MNRIYKSFILLLVFFISTTGSPNLIFGKTDGNPANNTVSTNKPAGNLPNQPGQEQKAAPKVITVINEKIPLYEEFARVLAYEKWEIISARNASAASLDKQFLLSPYSFFKFLDGVHVQFRLNEYYPVQNGEMKLTPLNIELKFYKDPGCAQCIDQMIISRKSETDKEYLLEFNGLQQLFTVNRIKIQK